jgi:hypothetical protein
MLIRLAAESQRTGSHPSGSPSYENNFHWHHLLIIGFGPYKQSEYLYLGSGFK